MKGVFMSIKKKLFTVAGVAVLMFTTSAMAGLEVKPYGGAQYRLRFEHGMLMPDADGADNLSTFDYSNRLCLRVGLKAEWDEQFSMQFQIGNNWGAAENVQWGSNLNGGNLYMQLAFFRWNPGAIFLEAGIVPLSGHGALDLIERSAGTTAVSSPSSWGRYAEANFNGWSDMNNSLAGIKLGVPIVKEGVKVGAELTQSVTTARTQSFGNLNDDGNPASRPSGVMTVLQIPVDAGAFKITPEMVAIFNKDVAAVTSGDSVGDHEMAFGAAGSYKINDGVTVTLRGAYAMYSNNNRMGDADATSEENGLLVGAGASVKAGPGTLQLAVDYNAIDNAVQEGSDHSFLYTDIRYAMRFHPRVTLTPRYRTYTRMLSNGDLRLHNRVELIVEGSF
jgi:hypothetical protein